MADRGKARRDLAEADRHTAGCEARVARQVEPVAAVRAAGGDMAASENLLATTKQALTELREQRRLVLASLDEQTLPPAGPEGTSKS